jgi:hypothetical protein
MRRRLPSIALCRALCCALCGALAASATARGAEPATATPQATTHEAPATPELALTWQAPAGCPSPTDVEAQFVRLLGGAARTPSGKHIAASALVRAATSERWSVELATVLDGAVGRRNLSGDSCASVSSAAALILALMIDPAAAERATAPEPAAPESPPEAPPPKPEPEAVVRTTAPPKARAVAGMARVFGGVVVGVLPAPAPAAGLALGARARRLGAELSIVATEQRRVTASPDTSGDFRLVAGGARACGELGGRVVVWHLCVGGELERVTGTGLVAPARSGAALMGAGTGGLLVAVPLGARLALSLDLDAAVRPYHPAFLDSDAQLFKIPLISGFAALGLMVTI